jgi:hypothetical protein
MRDVFVKSGHPGVERCSETAETAGGSASCCVIPRKSIDVLVPDRRIVTSDQELRHSDAVRESQATPLDKGTVAEVIWNLDQLDGKAVWVAPDPVMDQLVGILKNCEDRKSNFFLISRKARQPKNLSIINITYAEAVAHVKVAAEVIKRLQQYNCNKSSEVLFVSDLLVEPDAPTYLKRFNEDTPPFQGIATIGLFSDPCASAANAYVLPPIRR